MVRGGDGAGWALLPLGGSPHPAPTLPVPLAGCDHRHGLSAHPVSGTGLATSPATALTLTVTLFLCSIEKEIWALEVHPIIEAEKLTVQRQSRSPFHGVEFSLGSHFPVLQLSEV